MPFVVIAIILTVICFAASSANRKREQEKNAAKQESPKANIDETTPPPKPAPTVENGGVAHCEEPIDLPVDVLPNLYSLAVDQVTLRHHQQFSGGGKEFDYVTLKCKVTYRLNGRKEGKRIILFTGYNQRGEIEQIRGAHKKYHFTEAGFEFVEVCFDDFGNHPINRITLSVKEE